MAAVRLPGAGLFLRPALGNFVIFESSLNSRGRVFGHPLTPDLCITVQPPERGVLGAGVGIS